MNLEYVSKKIETILNDSNNPLYSSGFYFYVATDGFYIDKISNEALKKNIIPVFIGYQSGEITPIPNLEEVDYNINISLYFPIIYKEKFYKLQKYLMTTFVGRIIDFGHGQSTSEDPDEKISNALCNISIPTFTTIADAGLIEFKNWTKTNYGLAIDTASFWMHMNFILYTSTIKGLGQANGFAYGNEVKTTLSFSSPSGHYILEVAKIGDNMYMRNPSHNKMYDAIQHYAFMDVNSDIIYLRTTSITTGTNYYKYENDMMVLKGTITRDTTELANEQIITTNPSVQSQSEPAAQQLLGTKETEGLATSTSYSSGFNCFFKKDMFFIHTLIQWFSGELQNQAFTIELELHGIKYTRTCYLQSVMFNPTYGEPVTLTFTFVKKVV